MDSFTVRCPNCNAEFGIDPKFRGRVAECSACKARFRIPDAHSSGIRAHARSAGSSRKAASTKITLDLPTVMGFGGILLLMLGVFLPFVEVPTPGGINLFANGRGNGIVILAFALMAIAAVVQRDRRMLIFSALCPIALALLEYALLFSTLPESSASVDSIGDGALMILTGGILASSSAYWMKIRYQSLERPIALFLTYVVMYTIGLMGQWIGNFSWRAEMSFLHLPMYGEGVFSLVLLVAAFVLFVSGKARMLWLIALLQLGVFAFTVWIGHSLIPSGERLSFAWASIFLVLGPALLFVVSVIASGQGRAE